MEQSFLAYLRGRCRKLPQVALGIGDDAAVIDANVINGTPAQTIACTDQIVDKVDFDSDTHSLADVGYKAMAINLSDVAAMGCRPSSALVTLTLPKQSATRIAGEVYDGVLEAAEEFEIAIAGGDITTYDGPLAISVTLLGSVPEASDGTPCRPWRRSEAQEGDAIVVSGAVGGSLLGRHLRPEPRVALALYLRTMVDVHAAIDISDGLSLDLDRLCASSGVGAELDMMDIPIHDDAIQMSADSGRTPMEHAWSDGEDFELIMTMSQEDADRICAQTPGVYLTQIGNVVGRTGLWKRQKGKLERLSPQGYVHK